MKSVRLRVVGWTIGLLVRLLRLTCRIRIHNDPRPGLKDAGTRYVLAILHGHQLSALMAGEVGSGTMVSRSDDGEIIVPTLRVCGHVPIRGSSGNSKGGATALQSMISHVAGGRPASLTVDGPRGPRGKVQRGIGLLARKSDSVVVSFVAIPSRRWILKRTWDRLQIPKPFSTIDFYAAPPTAPREDESLQAFATRIERQLEELEREFDPSERCVLSTCDRTPAEQPVANTRREAA